MRKLTIATVMVVALIFSGSALAGETSVYLGGGMSMPMSPDMFKDYWKMGFGGAGGVGFQIKPGLEVGVTLGYSSFPLDDDKMLTEMLAEVGLTPADLEAAGITIELEAPLTALEILGYGKYTFGTGEAPFGFYMIGLAGMTKLSADDITMTATIPGVGTITVSEPGGPSATDITLGFGAGFDYMFSPTAGFWFDAKYMLILSEGESTAHLPLRAGVKFMFGGGE